MTPLLWSSCPRFTACLMRLLKTITFAGATRWMSSRSHKLSVINYSAAVC